jgi:DNA replication protein DnaC
MSFPAPTTTKSPELKEQLGQVGLVALAGCIEDFLARATKGRFSPRQVVEEIVRLEMTEGAKRSLERRLERSRIGRFKPVADFDWNWPKKIERDIIERALTLDFIEERRNLVLLGANGIGKTMIAKNLAYQAALAGHSVLFVTAAELLDDLRAEVAQATFRRKLSKYASPQILVIDEVGYLSYDHHAADLLYKVVDRRYEKKSIVLTTNLAFRDWNTVFPNATSIATLLDKLTHHADVTMIEGDSYRVHESQKEAAARRKKR